MTEDPPMVQELRALVRDKDRFAIEAYLFLYQSLDRAQQLVSARRHVDGQELLEGFRVLAGELFGPLALMVLRTWGVRKTEDVGQMVFDLVERGLMGKTPDDRLEDFQDVYDFDEVFANERMLAQIDVGCLVPRLGLVHRELPAAKRPVARSKA